MKIIKLTASNIKRLHAVEITPEGSTVIIGGKNAQGKSSVIDSISYALGGQKLIPSEPIRKGEASAEVEVNLGEIIVTRKFKRERLECDCGADIDDKPTTNHKSSCASHKFGETKSSLFVKTKEGLQYPSPQAVLDKLLGQLTFDPLAFVKADSTKQVETLRRVVKLDMSALNAERSEVYSERALLNKQVTTENARLVDMPFHKDDGYESVSLDKITTELNEATIARDAYDRKNESFNNVKADVEALIRATDNRQKQIADLELQLGVLKKAQADDLEDLRRREHELKVIGTQRSKLYNAIPDTVAITAKLADLNAKNVRINQNVKRQEQEKKIVDLKKLAEEKTDQITVIDATKRKMIESVKYPVDGLGFDFEKDEVTFNGLPFNQASTAEQIRVSVAIGLAINPKLRVLLVKDGSYLDKDGMRMIAKYAEEANAQFWIERVAESKDGAMVMIEDGAVA